MQGAGLGQQGTGSRRVAASTFGCIRDAQPSDGLWPKKEGNYAYMLNGQIFEP